MESHSPIEVHKRSITVYPGILACYHNLQGETHHFHHDSRPTLMEINYLHYGRGGWDLDDGSSIYVGEGDVIIHSAFRCADCTSHLPLGSGQLITLTLDLDLLAQELPDILRDSGIEISEILKYYCLTDRSVTFISNRDMEHIFLPLYQISEEMRLPYLQLKTQELLLYLYNHRHHLTDTTTYKSTSTETIREMHAFITEHLDTRYTIAELSIRFLMNSSTLKEVFKAVYGSPIATYMKEYRMRQAARLLRNTELSILEIANMVGYETQSKFSTVFKEIYNILPSAYRKDTKQGT